MSEACDPWVCAAGRTAFFGGRWGLPCFEPTEHQHAVISGLGRVQLCDKHFAEVNEAGLITDPYVSEDGAGRLVDLERKGRRR